MHQAGQLFRWHPGRANTIQHTCALVRRAWNLRRDTTARLRIQVENIGERAADATPTTLLKRHLHARQRITVHMQSFVECNAVSFERLVTRDKSQSYVFCRVLIPCLRFTVATAAPSRGNPLPAIQRHANNLDAIGGVAAGSALSAVPKIETVECTTLAVHSWRCMTAAFTKQEHVRLLLQQFQLVDSPQTAARCAAPPLSSRKAHCVNLTG